MISVLTLKNIEKVCASFWKHFLELQKPSCHCKLRMHNCRRELPVIFLNLLVWGFFCVFCFFNKNSDDQSWDSSHLVVQDEIHFPSGKNSMHLESVLIGLSCIQLVSMMCESVWFGDTEQKWKHFINFIITALLEILSMCIITIMYVSRSFSIKRK